MKISKEFNRFHEQNPHVYKMFSAYAKQAISKGYKMFSAKAVFERLRWYFAMETKGEVFKLNNNYTAYYARMFMADYPEYKGFFELRERKRVDT